MGIPESFSRLFSFVFHPHGWIRNTQVVELIDHVVEKHGKKVKFLTFGEALDRINKNLLAGQPLRHPKTGEDNGVRILDLDNDGFLDVVIANRLVRLCCKGCKEDLKEEPAKFIAAVDKASAREGR